MLGTQPGASASGVISAAASASVSDPSGASDPPSETDSGSADELASWTVDRYGVSPTIPDAQAKKGNVRDAKMTRRRCTAD